LICSYDAQDVYEKVDRMLRYIVKILEIPLLIISSLLLAVIIPKFWRRWRSIEIAPFSISDGGDAERRLLFAFARAREALLAIRRPPARHLNLVDRPFLISLPGLDADVPDTIEVGGLSFPVGALLRYLVPPKVRVSTNWRIGLPQGMAQAAIRRRWARRPAGRTHLTVDSAAGNVQDHQLRRFAHDTLTRAWGAA